MAFFPRLRLTLRLTAVMNHDTCTSTRLQSIITDAHTLSRRIPISLVFPLSFIFFLFLTFFFFFLYLVYGIYYYAHDNYLCSTFVDTTTLITSISGCCDTLNQSGFPITQKGNVLVEQNKQEEYELPGAKYVTLKKRNRLHFLSQ